MGKTQGNNFFTRKYEINYIDLLIVAPPIQPSHELNRNNKF